jgi:hypothetical protein
MFTDETEKRDWIFGIVVTALVIGGLIWINSQATRDESHPAVAESASGSPPAETSGESIEPSYGDFSTNEISHRRSPDVIERVFECERNGQRILSDRPCGADASVREIAAPNRMRAQDTSALYDPPPRSIQVQKLRASRQRTGSNAALCEHIDNEKDQINARMRKPYKNWEGERLRARLRQLSAQRWDAGCGR